MKNKKNNKNVRVNDTKGVITKNYSYGKQHQPRLNDKPLPQAILYCAKQF